MSDVLDFSIPAVSVPADLSSLTLPSVGDVSSSFNLPSLGAPSFSAPTLAMPQSITTDITGAIKSLGDVATSLFSTQAQIYQAQAAANVAKAQGQNAVQVAKAGLPSPQLLLFAGLGLAALLLVSKK